MRLILLASALVAVGSVAAAQTPATQTPAIAVPAAGAPAPCAPAAFAKGECDSIEAAAPPAPPVPGAPLRLGTGVAADLGSGARQDGAIPYEDAAGQLAFGTVQAPWRPVDRTGPVLSGVPSVRPLSSRPAVVVPLVTF